MTTVFDAAGKGSAKACWAFMRRARADRFESASSAAKPSSFQGGASCKIKKPDMYWSAHRGAERPVFSVVKISYVRRSEFNEEFAVDQMAENWRDVICALADRPPDLCHGRFEPT